MREEDYDAIVGTLYQKYWFSVHKAFIHLLGMEAAGHLHFLINYHGRVKCSKHHIWNNGWFYLTCEKYEEELAARPGVQKRILKLLQDARLIKISRMGLPAKRHIKINVELVKRTIDQWIKKEQKRKREEVKNGKSSEDATIGGDSQTGRTSQTSRTSRVETGPANQVETGPANQVETGPAILVIRNTSKKKGSNRQTKKFVRRPLGRRSRRDDSLFSDEDAKGSDQTRMESLARRIRFAVREEFPTLPMVRSRRMEQYVGQLRRLVKTGYSLEEVEAVLAWWMEHHGDEYVRKIRSLADIYDEFSVIKQLMESAKAKSSDGNGCVHRGVDGRPFTRENMNDTGNSLPNLPGCPRIWVDTDGKQYDGRLAFKLQGKCKELFPDTRVYYDQEQTDEALLALGEKPGSVPSRVASSV